MAQVTKAQLEAQLAEALARVETLEAGQLQPAQNHLVQTLWLGRQIAAQGVSKGGTPWARISGQYADRKPGNPERQWGEYKNLVAFGDNAEALLEIFNSGVSLVRVALHEEPQKPLANGRRISNWVIEEIHPVGKPPAQEQPTPATAEPSHGEPTDEELPF